MSDPNEWRRHAGKRNSLLPGAVEYVSPSEVAASILLGGSRPPSPALVMLRTPEEADRAKDYLDYQRLAAYSDDILQKLVAAKRSAEAFRRALWLVAWIAAIELGLLAWLAWKGVL